MKNTSNRYEYVEKYTNKWFECREINSQTHSKEKKKRYTNKLAANRPTDRHQQRKSEREQNCCYFCQNYLECFVVMVACLCTPTHAHRTHTQTEHLHNHTHSIATCLGVNVNASVVDFTTHNFMLCTREIFAIFSIFERNPIYIWICIEVSHCEICFRFGCVSLSLSPSTISRSMDSVWFYFLYRNTLTSPVWCAAIINVCLYFAVTAYAIPNRRRKNSWQLLFGEQFDLRLRLFGHELLCYVLLISPFNHIDDTNWSTILLLLLYLLRLIYRIVLNH